MPALSTLDAGIQELKYQVGKFFQIVQVTAGKPGLKLNIQKMKIMASGPITSWQMDGQTMETVTDFIFWAPESLQTVTTDLKLKDACFLKEKLWQT